MTCCPSLTLTTWTVFEDELILIIKNQFHTHKLCVFLVRLRQTGAGAQRCVIVQTPSPTNVLWISLHTAPINNIYVTGEISLLSCVYSSETFLTNTVVDAAPVAACLWTPVATTGSSPELMHTGKQENCRILMQRRKPVFRFMQICLIPHRWSY